MLYKTDEYGIREYNPLFLLLLAFAILQTYIHLMAPFLLSAEIGATGSNILSNSDAIWNLKMAAFTIGFGDVYPITETGRNIIEVTFYFGMTFIGIIVGLIAKIIMGFSDKSIQNRELRKQNNQIIALLKNNGGRYSPTIESFQRKRHKEIK